MLMYLGLQDTVQEEVIVTCILQYPDYNPGVSEPLEWSDTMRVREKEHILQDSKAYVVSSIDFWSQLGRATC